MTETKISNLQRIVNGKVKNLDEITKQEWAESLKRASKSWACREFYESIGEKH